MNLLTPLRFGLIHLRFYVGEFIIIAYEAFSANWLSLQISAIITYFLTGREQKNHHNKNYLFHITDLDTKYKHNYQQCQSL